MTAIKDNPVVIAVSSVVIGAALIYFGGKTISSVNAAQVGTIVESKVAVLSSKMESVESRLTKVNYKLNDMDRQLYEQNLMLVKIVERLSVP